MRAQGRSFRRKINGQWELFTNKLRPGLGLPWSKQTEWPAVRNFAAATGIGAENGRDQVAPAWRSVIRVNSEGRPSRSAKPGHSAVPLFTYSVIPSTS
jgi:hypothetical protein